MTPIYVSYDKRENRIDARLFIASHASVQDCEIGRHEQLAAEVEDGSPEALWLDENPFEYEHGDEDEIYQDLFGERVPKGMYCFFEDGDLFLGAHTDVAGDTQEDLEEAWESLKADLLAANFAPEWIGDALVGT